MSDKCAYCGIEEATELDHVFPVSKVDRHKSPRVPSCTSCNQIGGGLLFDSFEAKRHYIRGRRQSKRMPVAGEVTGAPGMLDRFLLKRKAPRKTAPYDKKYGRRTYRIRDETHEVLKDIAAAEDVGLNDLVRWVLQGFVEEYRSGQVVLPVEEHSTVELRLNVSNAD